MKIGFIQLYEVADGNLAAHGNYLDMFRELLAAANCDAEWRTYDARNGGLPYDVDECDAYLFSGSRSGVYEDLPWIPPLLESIRALDAARKKMVGICFGHQAIAQALGGRVEKSPHGWGQGRHGWQVCGERPWLQPPLSELHLLVSHQDQVLQLPPSADVLAASEFCPIAMFAVESHVFCLQGHPEFSRAYSHKMLEERKGTFPASVWQEAMDHLDLPNDRKTCAQWIAAFLMHDRA